MRAKKIIPLFLFISSFYSSAPMQASALSSLYAGVRSFAKRIQQNPFPFLALGATACAGVVLAAKGYKYYQDREAKKIADIDRRIAGHNQKEAVETVQKASARAGLIERNCRYETARLIESLKKACATHDAMRSSSLFSQVQLYDALEAILYDAAACHAGDNRSQVIDAVLQALPQDQFYIKKALCVAHKNGNVTVVKQLLSDGRINLLKDISPDLFIDEAIAGGMKRMVDVWMDRLFEESQQEIISMSYRDNFAYSKLYFDLACKIGSKKRVVNRLERCNNVVDWFFHGTDLYCNACVSAIKYKRYDLFSDIVEKARAIVTTAPMDATKERFYCNLLSSITPMKDYKAMMLLINAKAQWFPGLKPSVCDFLIYPNIYRGIIAALAGRYEEIASCVDADVIAYENLRSNYVYFNKPLIEIAIDHEQWKAVFKLIKVGAPSEWLMLPLSAGVNHTTLSSALLKKYKEKPSDELFALLYYHSCLKVQARTAFFGLLRESTTNYQGCVQFLEKVFKAKSTLKKYDMLKLDDGENEFDIGSAEMYENLFAHCCEADRALLVQYLIDQGYDCSALFSGAIDHFEDEQSKDILATLLKNNRRIKSALQKANQDQDNCFSRVNCAPLLDIMAGYCFNTPEHQPCLRDALTAANEQNNNCLGDPHNNAKSVKKTLDTITDYCSEASFPPSNLSEEEQERMGKVFKEFIDNQITKQEFKQEVYDYLFDGGSIYSLYLVAEKSHFKAIEILEDFFKKPKRAFLAKVHGQEGYLTPVMLQKIEAIKTAKKAERVEFEARELDEKQKKSQYEDARALFNAIKTKEALPFQRITKYTVNARDEHGNTPCHCAVINGMLSTLFLLMSYPPLHLEGDLLIKNNLGQTVLDRALYEYRTPAEGRTENFLFIIREIVGAITKRSLKSSYAHLVEQYAQELEKVRKFAQEKNDPALLALFQQS